MGDVAVRQVAKAWAYDIGKDECVAQLERNEEFFWLASEILNNFQDESYYRVPISW